MTLSPERLEAFKVIQLAELHLQQGNPQRALATLEQGGGAILEEPGYWFQRAWALYDLKRTDESITAARKGLALAPNGVWTLLILSLNLERIGKFGEAENALLHALQLAPENPVLLTHYALLVAKAGQWDKAERLQAEAERVAPAHSVVRQNRTKLAFIRGDKQGAVAGANQILADDAEDTFAQYVTGHLAVEQGAYAEAEKRFTAAARQNPNDKAVTDAVRHTRYLRHPLLIPLYPIEKFGSIPIWIGFIVVVYGLQALGQLQLAGIIATIYIIYVIYSWVVPRALKWYLARKR